MPLDPRNSASRDGREAPSNTFFLQERLERSHIVLLAPLFDSGLIRKRKVAMRSLRHQNVLIQIHGILEQAMHDDRVDPGKNRDPTDLVQKSLP